MSKKAQICPDYLVYFVKNLICDALSQFMTMQAKWMCDSLTQGIMAVKTFTKYEKCYCW